MELAVAVIFGVVTGVLYGLAALGVVLVYRVSRVLNFALAGTASITSFEASTLTGSHWPYWTIVLMVLASGALLGALCYGILKLAGNAGTIAVGVGTIGLLLLLQGSVGGIWGLNERTLPTPISGTFRLGNIGVSHFEVLAVVVALVAIFGSFLLILHTRLGLRMRAVSAGPRTAELLGVNRSTTELSAWAIGGAAGSLAGLLIVPLFQLDQSFIITFTLAAFAAVVLGGFTSLGGVVLAGITVSIVLNVLATYVSSTSTNTFTFLLVAVVLFLRPHGLFGFHERSVSEPDIPAARRRPFARFKPSKRVRRNSGWTLPDIGVAHQRVPAGQVGLAVILLALLVYGFASGQSTAYVFATALASYVAVLGTGTIAGISGQVSLGQGAFVGIGAYASGVVSAHLHVSVWVALPLALVVGALVGLVIGWPAARLAGVYLIVFTLAFGLAVPEILNNWTSLTGGANGLTVSVPSWMQNAHYQYLVALAVAVVATAAFVLASRTQPGRRWRATRDSETAAAAIGWSPTINKVTAFAFGSALAALGGAMSGILTGYVSPDGFSVFLSIYLIVAVVIGGPGTVLGSLVGALVITLLPYYLAGSNTPQVIFGIAVVVILILAPDGVANRLSRRRSVPAFTSSTPAIASASTTELSAPGGPPIASGPTSMRLVGDPVRVVDPILEVNDLTVAYDGGPALSRFSLQVGRGEAIAVVGPNGAGKSTLLRALSGWVRPVSGHVLLEGQDLSGLLAHQISRLGLAHAPEGRCIFPDLTVAENLRLGLRSSAGATPSDLLDRVLATFPKLQTRMGQQAGTMSGGEQQMLAVGRGLMADPRVLLLDEPSLGLAPVVIGEMFAALSEIRASGLAVLIVEQNVHAALGFADRGYVLSRGECVMTGTSSALTANDDLIRAFLVQA